VKAGPSVAEPGGGAARVRPVLYSFRRCPYAMRARLALGISGMHVELREVVLRNKPAHMVELSPKATVPVLWLPDGRVIDESLDIMLWSLAVSDPADWLPPEDQRPQALALVARNDGEFKHHLDRYKYPHRYENAVAEQHRQAAGGVLSDLDAMLAKDSYLSGSRWGLVDAAILPFIRQFANTDKAWFETAPYPRLRSWLEQGLLLDVFVSMMKKYLPWQSGEPGVLFPGEDACDALKAGG
jgi:glutathione S-transferase